MPTGGAKMGKDEARCMKCKKIIKVKNAVLSKPSKGPFQLKGVCPKCGTRVFAFKARK